MTRSIPFEGLARIRTVHPQTLSFAPSHAKPQSERNLLEDSYERSHHILRAEATTELGRHRLEASRAFERMNGTERQQMDGASVIEL